MKTGIAGVCLLSLMCSGCASIWCGTEKTVTIQSEPSRAKFTIVDGSGTTILQSTTPANVKLKRGRGYFQAGDYTVKFQKPGYEEVTVPIRQELEAGWYFVGNFFIGGLLGWFVIDPLTGGMWGMEPGLYVTLHEEPKLENTTTSDDRSEYRLKRDASGDILKDSKGSFIIERVSGSDGGG